MTSDDRHDDAIAALGELTSWSGWHRLIDAAISAPRLPGVYRVREGSTGPLVYIGMAGERKGGGRPMGLQGRLRVYASGKALTSGLGEALADRAFADPIWLGRRLSELEGGNPMRAREWGRATVERADPYVSWAITTSRDEAIRLEALCIRAVAHIELWNRQR